MSSNFWADLSNDYEKILESGFGYDVIIYVGEEPNHFLMKDGKFIFRKPNISPQLFDIILGFIYCGNIGLNNLQGIDILKLLIADDELNIQPLVSHIQEFLIEHKTEFLRQNPTDILETIYHHETFTNLCFEIIRGNPKILFNSNKFINLKASLLELLLERDDLNMDETEIWENLLKWYSIIIESKHIALFSSWIDKKDSSYYNEKKTPYNFKLFKNSRFNSTQLIRGYNPLDWNGNCDWKYAEDSFLFNFTDGNNISTAKLSYINDMNYAIFCDYNQGPSMGDLECYNSNNWRYYYDGNYYPDMEIPGSLK
ncbi:BTB/POZ protein [Rhizophagus clarus]|uniref:BTB/POZ protein n=1 Tax=Rhizophagus clarus TaxID=94130 RepID=A0A8H3QPV2_9GLOM|nr:BTB/POZ protein [Rhizophagus clarus]